MDTQSQSFRLDGRLAIITGASKGIGLGIAKAMSKAGASILLVSRQTPDLDNAANEIRGGGGKAEACPFDLHNYPQLNDWYAGVVSEHGIPDILVADLGSYPPTDRRCGSVVWLRGKADGTYTPITILEVPVEYEFRDLRLP